MMYNPKVSGPFRHSVAMPRERTGVTGGDTLAQELSEFREAALLDSLSLISAGLQGQCTAVDGVAVTEARYPHALEGAAPALADRALAIWRAVAARLKPADPCYSPAQSSSPESEVATVRFGNSALRASHARP